MQMLAKSRISRLNPAVFFTVRWNTVISKKVAQQEAERCLLCTNAPCASACPAATKPDKFLRQLRFDNPVGAAETVLDTNPLGGVCGAICPVAKLCEGACIRNAIDGPVKIGAVQRYLHEVGKNAKISNPPMAKKNSNKVAIVGSGPAGLAAARELARRGSQVTVFEKRQEAGGALRYALAPQRMNHKLVKEEVARIEQMGVDFQFNKTITDPMSLLSEGFNQVFFAPGLQDSRPLEHLPPDKVVSALRFLEGVNSEPSTEAHRRSEEYCRGKDVVVVGGGSVAMDCAVTAASLGASRVHIVARKKLANLSADVEEIRHARESGAVFHTESVVHSFSADGNSVHLTHFVSSEVDGAVHKFGSVISSSSVILAVGQMLDDVSRQVLSEDGKINIEDVTKDRSVSDKAATPSTSSPVVFSGGDATRSGGTDVVQAVADGKLAASLMQPNIDLPERPKISLETKFCDIVFENPFCLSSGPATNTAEMIARSYDAGWAGSYFKTLNRDDQFEVFHPSPRLNYVKGVGIQNVEQISDRPLAHNLADITWLRKNYPNKIMGVSIMGFCDEDWRYLAAAAEGAGAHLLEMNFSCPQMARTDAGHHVGQQFDLIERYTSVVKRAVNIPVVAKLTPNTTDMIPAALSAQAGGADAVSTINTIKAISHVDVLSSLAEPTIANKSSISGFSGKGCRPIGLRFVAELAKERKLTIPISGMGGIYTWKDATEYLLLGASNIQVTTAVMEHGFNIVEDMIDGLQRYLSDMGRKGVSDIVGVSKVSLVEPISLDHTTEVVSRIEPSRCIGCGACEVACKDGAVQAITMVPTKDGKSCAEVDPLKCIGCKMCEFVCPVEGAVLFDTRKRIARSG